ncbi:MAG: polyribonucleotide nucleotidyltransferase [Candidatus Makana argininalis]
MFKKIVHKFKYGNKLVTLETGAIARQATSSVLISIEDTVVLVTVVCEKKEKEGFNFLPLNVNYQERYYAVGKFPGSFFRREGRPSENEIIISRFIDRPIRPLFPEKFMNEIQIIATAISVNPQINTDIVALIGTSAVLSISGIPFEGPIGVARIGYINNNFILNPNYNEIKNSNLNLVISGTKNSILMIESESDLLNENIILNAIEFGHISQNIIIDNINLFSNLVKEKKFKFSNKLINNNLIKEISKLSKLKLNNAFLIKEKKDRINKINLIKSEINTKLVNNNKNLDENKINIEFDYFKKRLIRNKMIYEKFRIDGRKKNKIRKLDIKLGVLPRTHGSSIFTRGETQALVTITLGTERDAQNIDEITGDRIDRFLLHYNFPPYCIGEIGLTGSPKRREIGHGCLAKKGIKYIMPSIDKFPYTIRVVSEITESNGSSSMATVCGASLALMDAGVPIKSHIAGISIGLIKEGNKIIILNDIIGDEDNFGDMDFKIVGNGKEITALQMDIKISGVNINIIKKSLQIAKTSLFKILKYMNKKIKFPRNNISKYAPRIHIIKVNPNKIKDIIGKGGSVIKSITEETGTTIEIENCGKIKISSINENKAINAINIIKQITAEIEVGSIYNGKVTRIVNFGAFVSINNFKEGLVHISQISKKRVYKVDDYLSIFQEVLVKVIEIDNNGRVKLSIKDANSFN